MTDNSEKRKTREEIRAEWEALGMAPRLQSPTELRRVLMTWSKAQLVEFLIRAESDEIKARDLMLRAWHDSQANRQYALILPREQRKHEEWHDADPFNAWIRNLPQFAGGSTTMDARDVFMEGWKARARADEATVEQGTPQPIREHAEGTD